MTFSINSSNKFLCLLLLAVLWLTGCAGMDRVAPPPPVVKWQVTLQGAPVARLGSLRWNAVTSGEDASVSYEVRVEKDGQESFVSHGGLREGGWAPKEAGRYRLKMIVRDEEDVVISILWSDEYLFVPQLDSDSLYAVLPMENLSDSNAPLKDLQATMRGMLTARGFNLLDPVLLEKFMAKYRMRHVGGLSRDLSSRMQTELGVSAVFVTSLETWQEDVPPRVSIITRVIATGEEPEVLWIDSVGLTGDDSPGLLGLGRIKNPRVLLQNALAQLFDSYMSYLSGNYPVYLHDADTRQVFQATPDVDTSGAIIYTEKKKHQPQFFYRASMFNPAGQYKVAVIPFVNINARKHAEKIIALHLVQQLNRHANLRVFEPGLVRETLLRYRMIMQTGPSMASSDVLQDRDILGADLIVSGKVFDYQGAFGESKVDFSVQVFDGLKREVVWASRSYATGNQGVYFFDWGRVPSAHGLAGRMTQAVISLLTE